MSLKVTAKPDRSTLISPVSSVMVRTFLPIEAGTGVGNRRVYRGRDLSDVSLNANASDICSKAASPGNLAMFWPYSLSCTCAVAMSDKPILSVRKEGDHVCGRIIGTIVAECDAGRLRAGLIDGLNDLRVKSRGFGVTVAAACVPAAWESDSPSSTRVELPQHKATVDKVELLDCQHRRCGQRHLRSV